MQWVKRENVEKRPLPGRMLQLVVGGADAVSASNMMTMGFARYSAESGPMAPHRHAEEIVLVLASDRGYVRYGGSGDQPDQLGDRMPLEADMVLHFPENEWHVFEFDEGGHVDIAFFYSNPNVYTAANAGQSEK